MTSQQIGRYIRKELLREQESRLSPELEPRPSFTVRPADRERIAELMRQADRWLADLESETM